MTTEQPILTNETIQTTPQDIVYDIQANSDAEKIMLDTFKEIGITPEQAKKIFDKSNELNAKINSDNINKIKQDLEAYKISQGDKINEINRNVSNAIAKLNVKDNNVDSLLMQFGVKNTMDILAKYGAQERETNTINNVPNNETNPASNGDVNHISRIQTKKDLDAFSKTTEGKKFINENSQEYTKKVLEISNL